MKRTVFSLVLLLCLLGMLTLVLNVPPVMASGTVYIRADGSVEGTSFIQTTDNVNYVFTANINNSLIVERDNIVIDGNGYVLQGIYALESIGIDLSNRINVTVRNVQIDAFDNGVKLNSSSSIRIFGSSITNNEYGIWLLSCSNNMIVGNNITNNYIGINLLSATNNSIRENMIAVNNRHGIFMEDSTNNNLTENNITANEPYGVYLKTSSNNTLIGNNITANIWEGMILSTSSNNTFIRNNVIANGRMGGFYIEWSSNNIFFHNNIINNTGQLVIPTPGYENFWDNGFEGNYWSSYDGTDADHDGIGDAPYVLDASNQDNFPLMSPYIPGDCNHDGIVNIKDAARIGAAWNKTMGTPGYNPHADLNMDGVISMADADVVRENWLRKWTDRV